LARSDTLVGGASGAIARAEEKSLTRCVPGGKATSRKLRELVETDPTKAAAPLSVAAPDPPATGASADSPFVAEFRGADSLNGSGSGKETRHIIFAVDDGAANYEVGDSLGIFARNSADLVAAIIERLGVEPETPVLSPDGAERSLVEALSDACEIRRPSDRAIEVLASRALDRDESVVLQAMAEGNPGAGPEDADLLDLLETFPSARPPLSELTSALDPLQPRLYSIASIRKAVPGTGPPGCRGRPLQAARPAASRRRLDLSGRPRSSRRAGAGVRSSLTWVSPAGVARHADHYDRPRHRRRAIPRLSAGAAGSWRPRAQLALLRKPAAAL